MNSKVLIAYYSHSGNTRAVAENLEKLTGGTLIELCPETPYPTLYNALLDRAKQELQAHTLPPLSPLSADPAGYSLVLLGTPNWCGTMAPPMASFLREHRFSGKHISAFCTHGGSGLANVMGDLKKSCPEAEVLPGFECYGNGGPSVSERLAVWLKKLGV